MHGTAHVATNLGMRRVTFVRVVVSEGGLAAEVVGIGHRLPSTHRVSLATAATLAAGGVPTVHVSPGHRPPAGPIARVGQP